MIVMVRNNKMLTSRHKKAPESFDSEALDHDYYIWVKNGNLRKLEIEILLHTVENNVLVE